MFGNTYHGKKVLITGNTGFKGSWLSLWLKQLGATVHGLANGIPTQPSLYEALHLEELLTFHEQDIRAPQLLIKLIQTLQPDFIFHLAAQAIVKTGYDDPLTTFATNTMGTANICEALRLSGHPCTAILITSDKCYDNIDQELAYVESDTLGGKDPYSGSKGAAELVIKSYYHSYFKDAASPVRIASVRAGNVIGGGDWAPYRILPDCIRAWTSDQQVILRNPHATRPWQFVLEPLSGYLRLGQLLHESPALNGAAFNFGPALSEIRTVQDMIELAAAAWGVATHQSAFQAKADHAFHEAAMLHLSSNKAKEHLQWSASLRFEELVQFTVAWYIAYYAGTEDLYAFSLDQIRQFAAIAAARQQPWASTSNIKA